MKVKCLVIACSLSLLLASCGTRFAVTSNGENLSALTKVTDGEYQCVSPYGGDNGKDLFFAVEEKGEYFNIFKKDNPFSNAMSQKTSGKNHNFSPAYNAVIDKIAFRCQLEGSLTSDIYMMPNNQGKALTQVTETNSSNEGHPSFSSDGQYLIYDKVSYSYYKNPNFWALSRVGIVENSEIWIRDLKTGENTLLGNGAQPSLSSDGKNIVFVRYSSDAKSCSIWTMGIDGSNLVQVTDAKKGFAFHPRYSPDGKKIVFDCYRKDKKDNDIYIIDTDGNNLTQITINKSYDGQPYWTTDGYIYFVSDRGTKEGNRQIWRFKL